MILSFSLFLSVCLTLLLLSCSLSLYFNVIFCSVQCLAGPWIRLRHGSSEAQSEKRVPGRKPLHRIIQLPPTASACAGIPMALSACLSLRRLPTVPLYTSDTTAEDCRAWPRLQNSLHLTFLQNGCSWPCSDLLMCHKMPTVSNYYTRLVPYLKLTTMIQSLDQSTPWFLTLLQKETKVLPFSDDPLWSPQKPKSGSCTRRR